VICTGDETSRMPTRSLRSLKMIPRRDSRNLGPLADSRLCNPTSTKWSMEPTRIASVRTLSGPSLASIGVPIIPQWEPCWRVGSLHVASVLISMNVIVGLAVITGLNYPSRVAIQMLQELYTEFNSKYATEAGSAKADAFTKKAKGLLKDTCTKYDDLSKVDKTSSILSKVDEVKSSMQSNIANMLKNSEQAESLAEKSDQLNEQASVFKKRSTDLRKQMAWKDFKMTLILGGVIVIVLIIIIVPLVNHMRS
jgi:vesicle-associated membrane protein 7